jgi:hypothetical protein
MSLAFVLGLLSCSSTEPSASSFEAGTRQDSGDASAAVSAAPDAESDANACVTEAGGFGIACLQSLASYCAGASDALSSVICGDDWQAVLADPPCHGPVDYGIGSDCTSDGNDFESMTLSGVDSGTAYFYDQATGALVAIVDGSNGYLACLAGPPCFAAPTCVLYQQMACPEDGGSEAAGDVAVLEAAE